MGVASAQSTVTLSGGVVFGVGGTKYGTTNSGLQTARSTGNLAFSGTEDLGGGLKASFRVETSIGATGASQVGGTGATSLGDRGMFLTLAGGFGTVLVGTAPSAIRANMGAVGNVTRLNPLYGLSGASAAQSASGVVSAATATDATARVIYGDAYSQQIAYESPDLSGFRFTLGVAPVEGDTSTTGDTKSMGLNYAAGPLMVRFNVTDVKETVAVSGSFATGTGYKLNTLTASYDLGVARVGVTHQTIDMASGTDPAAGTALTVHIPMGAGQFGLGYGRKGASAATNTTRVGADDVKQYFVGYRHDLSKRTFLELTTMKLDRSGGNTTDIKQTHVLIGHTF